MMKHRIGLATLGRILVEERDGEAYMSEHLPLEAISKGWRLEWRKLDEEDPVFLLDRDRQIIHRWDYIPTLGEVSEVCEKLLGSGEH